MTATGSAPIHEYDMRMDVGQLPVRSPGVGSGFHLRHVFERHTYRLELWTDSRYSIFCHYLLNDSRVRR